MAKKRNRNRRWNAGRIPEHPLVRDAVDNVAAPPTLTLLTGFGGRSSRRGYDRLYLDDELRDYVDIPRRAISRAEKLPASSSRPWGGTAVWVGFADPADIERYPVLQGGEEVGVISSIDDLRSIGGGPSAVVESADLRRIRPPGGGGPRPTGPTTPPPPPPPPRPGR